MASLVISPHLDDAILSLGGFLQKHNDKNDLVFTLFNTAWTILEGNYSVQKITEINLTEEKGVINLIGCQHKFGGYDEALLRGYKNWNDELRLDDEEILLNSIVNQINTLIEENNFTEVFFPLAVGKHVDHVLVYEASKKIINHLDNKNIKVAFYEDLPYAIYGGKDERLDEVKNDYTLSASQVNISNYFQKKYEYLKFYKSQLTEDDLEKIKKYAYNNVSESDISENIWLIN